MVWTDFNLYLQQNWGAKSHIVWYGMLVRVFKESGSSFLIASFMMDSASTWYLTLVHWLCDFLGAIVTLVIHNS